MRYSPELRSRKRDKDIYHFQRSALTSLFVFNDTEPLPSNMTVGIGSRPKTLRLLLAKFCELYQHIHAFISSLLWANMHARHEPVEQVERLECAKEGLRKQNKELSENLDPQSSTA